MGIGAILLKSNYLSPKNQNNNTLPPVSERVNPEPTTGYALEVGEVDAGSKLTIASVTLQSDAYVVVLKNNQKSAVIGKSELLSSGQHSDVLISLTSQVVDGDVVYIKLQNKSGEFVQGDTNVDIEVMKPVGMIMAHYENEY